MKKKIKKTKRIITLLLVLSIIGCVAYIVDAQTGVFKNRTSTDLALTPSITSATGSDATGSNATGSNATSSDAPIYKVMMSVYDGETFVDTFFSTEEDEIELSRINGSIIRNFDFIVTKLNTKADFSGTSYDVNTASVTASDPSVLYVEEKQEISGTTVVYYLDSVHTIIKHISDAAEADYTLEEPEGLLKEYTSNGIKFVFSGWKVGESSDSVTKQVGETVHLSGKTYLHATYTGTKIDDPSTNTNTNTNTETDINTDINANANNNYGMVVVGSGDEGLMFYFDGTKDVVAEGAFAKLKDTKDVLVVDSGNGNNLTFSGSDITNPKTIDPKIEVKSLESDSKINKLVDNGVIIDFAENGELPGKATVGIKATDAMKELFGDAKLNVYYYNEDDNSMELVATNISLDGNFYYFDITHNSSYILTTETIDTQKAKDEGKTVNTSDNIKKYFVYGYLSFCTLALCSIQIVSKKHFN